MQRVCKLEISECLPTCIPKSLVLGNSVEYTHSTKGCRRWNHAKHHQSWSSTIKWPALGLLTQVAVISSLENHIAWEKQ